MKYSLKPKYHFFPITGWINDPNGLVYYKNKYHMFYQYNPSNPEWGPMHWGHAVSDNMFNWNHLPVALYPDETYKENDISGIFSGSALEFNGDMVLMYTQFFDPKCYENHQKEQQCIAFSSNGKDFEKYSKNPVISSPPGESYHDFRDPKIFKGEEGGFYCVLGSGDTNIGKVLLYSSDDLKKWKFEDVLFEMDKEDCEPILECPDFFKLGDKWVLLFSGGFLTEGARKNYYIVGDFRDKKFYPEYNGELDLGNDIYASQTFIDDMGRRILIGWIHTPERYNYTKDEGWAGIMSIPRRVFIKNNKIYQEPAKEIEKYLSDFKLNEKDKNISIKECENSFLIEVDKINETSSLVLENSRDSLVFNFSKRDIEITENRNKKKEFKDFYHLDYDIESVKIYIDKSSMEIFINSGECVCTWRVYPQDNYKNLKYENLFEIDIKIRKITTSFYL